MQSKGTVIFTLTFERTFFSFIFCGKILRPRLTDSLAASEILCCSASTSLDSSKRNITARRKTREPHVHRNQSFYQKSILNRDTKAHVAEAWRLKSEHMQERIQDLSYEMRSTYGRCWYVNFFERYKTTHVHLSHSNLNLEIGKVCNFKKRRVLWFGWLLYFLKIPFFSLCLPSFMIKRLAWGLLTKNNEVGEAVQNLYFYTRGHKKGWGWLFLFEMQMRVGLGFEYRGLSKQIRATAKRTPKNTLKEKVSPFSSGIEVDLVDFVALFIPKL